MFQCVMPAREHGAVILFGVFHDLCILHREKVFILRGRTVFFQVLMRFALQFGQLQRDALFAGVCQRGFRRAVHETVEAAVARAGIRRGGGVGPVQIIDHGMHGGIHAVKVKAVKTDGMPVFHRGTREFGVPVDAAR